MVVENFKLEDLRSNFSEEGILDFLNLVEGSNISCISDTKEYTFGIKRNYLGYSLKERPAIDIEVMDSLGRVTEVRVTPGSVDEFCDYCYRAIERLQ